MSLLGLSACHGQKNITKQNTKDKAPLESRKAAPLYGVPTENYSYKEVAPTPDSVVQGIVKNDTEPREPQVTVYGVPTVDYVVKGRVVDAKGRPIKNVVVSLVPKEIDMNNMPDNPYWERQLRSVSDTTDAEGNFKVETTDRPWEQPKIIVRDVDGKKNGSFENQSVDVDFGEMQNHSSMSPRSMKVGDFSAEITVKMNPKK